MHEQRGMAWDLQKSMEIRRKTVGAFPVIALTEYVSFLLIYSFSFLL